MEDRLPVLRGPPEPRLRDTKLGDLGRRDDDLARLARGEGDLLPEGNCRDAALGALYLSSLAHLAARDLISLARFKSNLDYERELGRRAHALPELLGVFRQSVFIFDRVWYGLHDVDRLLLDEFAHHVERIKAQ